MDFSWGQGCGRQGRMCGGLGVACRATSRGNPARVWRVPGPQASPPQSRTQSTPHSPGPPPSLSGLYAIGHPYIQAAQPGCWAWHLCGRWGMGELGRGAEYLIFHKNAMAMRLCALLVRVPLPPVLRIEAGGDEKKTEITALCTLHAPAAITAPVDEGEGQSNGEGRPPTPRADGGCGEERSIY